MLVSRRYLCAVCRLNMMIMDSLVRTLLGLGPGPLGFPGGNLFPPFCNAYSGFHVLIDLYP